MMESKELTRRVNFFCELERQNSLVCTFLGGFEAVEPRTSDFLKLLKVVP